MNADTPIAHPTHVPRDRSVVKQLQSHRFADFGLIGVNHHRAGRGNIPDPNNMIMPPVRQDRRLELPFGVKSRLVAFVKHALDGLGNLAAIETELAGQGPSPRERNSNVIVAT